VIDKLTEVVVVVDLDLDATGEGESEAKRTNHLGHVRVQAYCEE